MSSVFEKALSLEWNGKVFILTMRNEITANTTVAGNTFLYSYDGKSWLPSSNITTSSLSNTNPYNIKWTGQRYLMETAQNINQSRDGLNWSPLNTTFPVTPNLTLANFSTLSPTNLSDTNIALSGDGTMVVVSKYASGSTIYYSKYSGGVWSALTSTGISTAGAGWKGISLSYTGSPMLISGSENSLYIFSTGTWTKSAVFSPSDTQGSALSQDGTRAVFAFYSGGFGFFSYSGSTWSSQTSVTINTTTYPSATYNSFKGIGMNLQGTTVVLYATSNSSFFYSNYNGSTWSSPALILTSTVVPAMNLNNGIEIDFWNNIYIGGYGSRYVFYSAYNAKAIGNKWSEFSTIIDASYNPIGFSVSENGRMAIATSNGNAYVYDNIVSGIYDTEINLEQTNTISFPQNTTLALGGVLADTTKIAYSTDSGLTWTPAQSSASVFSTSCNNATWNGKIWVAVGSGGNTIATSPDGRTWTGRGSYIFTTQGNAVEWSKELCLWVAVGQGTNSIAYSTDGIYWFSALAASSQGLTTGTDIKWNSRTWVATGTSSLIGIFTSSDGQNWTQVSPSNIALPPITNYGGTWTQASQITNTWIINAMNYTGQYQTAVDASGAIYTSSNFGAAWSYSQFTLPSFTQPLVAFLAIGSSGSQQYLLTSGGGLWISSTFGAAWSYSSILTTNSYWTSIATDSAGLYVLASSTSSVAATAGLWLSANSGATWSQIGSYSSIPFNGCTVSATGRYMSAIDIYGGIYISSNYGASWSISVVGSNFIVPTEIAGSSSGQYLTACNYGTNTYTVDAYYTMLSSATNGIMDNAGNIYMGGSQSVPSQVIYKISSSGVITPVGNVGTYVNQGFSIAIDNTNGLLYFIGVSGPTVYKTVISTGVTTTLTALNTSLNGVSTATPSGIVCDTTGNLYILTSSTGGTTAYVCSYTTGLVFSTIITKTVTTGGLALGIDKSNNIYLSYPNQVDQYSNGGALVTSGFYNSGRLVKYMTFDIPGNGYFYDVSGVYKVTLGQSSTYPSTQTFISGITSPYFIIQDINGYFYITSNGGSKVLQYNSNGSLLNANFITGLTNVNCLIFDSFNNLYVINQGANTIYQYKITNGSITTTNTSFITTGLNSPQACTFDKFGNFYVTNYSASATTGYICKYTMSNTSTNTITGTNTSFITGINNPWNITSDSVGNIYYAELFLGYIKKYSTSGVLTTFISGLYQPLGVAIDSLGNFYVTQYQLNYISKYSSSGSLINASYITNLSYPMVIIFDSSQNLYATNLNNNTITKTAPYMNIPTTTGLSSPQYTTLSSSGLSQSLTNTPGTITKTNPIASYFITSSLSGPFQAAFDNNGNIYVTNSGANTVSQFNSSGSLINANFITGLTNPYGIVFDSQNNLYIANQTSGTAGFISKYVITNGSLTSSNTSFITGIAGPQGLLIDSSNNLYISLANGYGASGYISKYTTSGTLVTSSFISSLGQPWQMAFDSNNNLYIAIYNNNCIAKYSYNGTLINSTFISFTSPFGLAIDASGNIYISNYTTSGYIGKYNYTGQLITSSYVGLTGLNRPVLFSFDNLGNLFVPITSSNAIYKITTTQTTSPSPIPSAAISSMDSQGNITVFNSATGTGTSYAPTSSNFITTGLNGPGQIARDLQGNYYVTNGMGSAISQYSPSGSLLNANFLTSTNGLTYVISLVFDSQNNLYITNRTTTSTGFILKCNIVNGALNGTPNASFITGLAGPQAIAIDSANNLYISILNNYSTGSIAKYTTSGTLVNATFITGLSNPWQIAFDILNNIYIANAGTNTIVKYSYTGTLINSTFISVTTPFGIVIDPNGFIYTCSYASVGFVSKYTNTGATVTNNYANLTNLNYPQMLALDNSGNLYTAVSAVYGASVTVSLCAIIKTTVNKLTPNTIPYPQITNIDSYGNTYTANYNQSTITTSGPIASMFTNSGMNAAEQVAIDNNGNVYVSNMGGTVSQYNSSGTLLNSSFITSGSSPLGMIIDSANNLYLVNRPSGTTGFVAKYAISNGSLSSSNTSFITSLLGPQAIMIDSSNILYISQTNNYGATTGFISKYTTSGTLVTASFISSLNNPNQMAIDSNKNIYIVLTGGNYIAKYSYSGSVISSTFIAFTSPMGLAIDSYNNIYVSQYSSTSLISKYSSTGAIITPTYASIGGVQYVNYLTFDASNNLYATLGSNIIYKISQTTNINNSLISSPQYTCVDSTGAVYTTNSSLGTVTKTGPIVNNYIIDASRNFIQIIFDNNGYAYTSSVGGNAICQYSASTGTLINANFITGLTTPIGIAFDSQYNLYICNKVTGASGFISKHVITNGSLISSNLTFITSLSGPQSIAIDSNNYLYIGQINNSTANAGFISKYTTSGTLVTTSFISSLSTPQQIALDSYNNIYVAQNASNYISKYSYSGTAISTTFISVTGPNGLIIDNYNNIYVSINSASGYVAKYSPTGTLISNTYSGSNITYGNLYFLSFDLSNNLHFSNLNNGSQVNTIYKITQTTQNYLTGLSSPTGCCLDSINNLYVSNSGAGTVIQYGPNVASSTTPPGVSTVNFATTGLASPWGICADSNGYIYVLNQFSTTTNGISTVIQYYPNGTVKNASFIPAYASGGSGTCSIAIDSYNNLYIINGAIPKILQYSINSSGNITASNTSFITSGLSTPQYCGFDYAGNLYVTNYNGNNSYINKYVMYNGTILSTTASFISGTGWNSWQMAFDTANNIYVCNLNGNIYKYNSSGTLVSSTFITVTGPVGIAIDAFGYFYTSTWSSGGYISKYTPTGTLVTSTYVTSLNYGALLTFINGNLYIPLALGGNTAGGSVLMVTNGTNNFATTGLASPFMVCFDSNGFIYVANENATTTNGINTVIQYNPNGTVKNANFVSASSSGEINLWGMAIDAYNNMYIVSGNQSKVFQYSIDSSGNIKSSNTSFITSGLSTPQSCCFDNAGNFYVSCYNGGNGYINKYVMSYGTIIITTANYVTGVGNAWQMAFDSGNNLYVCNLNGNIYKYSSYGTLISSTFISIGAPMGIAIDPFGYIYISVYSGSGYIAKYSSSGTIINNYYVPSLNYPAQLSYNSGYLYIPVSTGTGQATGSVLKITSGVNPTYISTLNSPQGCIVDNNSNLYIANNGSGTISKYGQPIASSTTPYSNTTFATVGVCNPWQICIDTNGYIYVVNQYSITGGVNTVIQYNPNGTVRKSNFITAYASTGTQNWSIAIDAYNNLYVIYGVSPYKVYQYSMDSNSNISSSNLNFITSGLNQPQACAFDKNGNFYVTNFNAGNNGFINKYVMSNGSITSTTNNYITISGSNNLWQMAFDSLNNLYVATITGSKILKYNSSGALISSTFITGVTNAIGIAIDPYDYIYTVYQNSGIAKYNSAGTLVTSTYFTNSTYNALITYNNGYLYLAVPTTTGSTPSSSGYILKFGIFGNNYSPSFISSITSPKTIALDSTNNLYITNGSYISKYNSSGTLVSQSFPTITSSTFTTIATNGCGLCCDANNNFYVTNSSGNYVSKITSAGTVNNSFITGITNPTDCKIDPYGNFFVVCSANPGLVYQFPPTGGSTPTYTFTVGNSPYYGTFDIYGNFYIANSGSGTISKINAGATNSSGVQNSYITGYATPVGIACDSNNNIYIGDYNNGKITVIRPGTTVPVLLYTASGVPIFNMCISKTFLYMTAASTIVQYNITSNTIINITTQYSNVVGLTFDYGKVNLYAIDRNSTTMYKITNIYEITSPTGLAIDSGNNVYVTSGNTVQKFNSSGALITGTYLQNLSSPIGLAIDSVQNLYVVQNGSNSITQYNTNTLLSQTVINTTSNTVVTYLPSSYGFSTNPTNLFTMDSANNLYLSAPYPYNSFVIYKYSASILSTYYANAATPYLANDASYNLYWTTNANTVIKFNPYTKSQSTFLDISGSQQGVSVLQAPQGLTFDISQNLYLCCSGNIIKVAAGTKAVSTFSTVQSTYAIIADSSANIYTMAATTPSHTVYKITQAGVQTTFFDSTKGLYYGYGLAIDAPGNIYIGSVNQAQTQTVIYKISPQGTQTTVYTTSTVNSVLGYAPLSVDKYSNLYLYDNNQIVVINPNGNSSAISEVSTLPTSIAFDNNNTIYMTDTSYNTSLNTILMGNTTINTSSNYGATWTVGSLQNITAIANGGQYQSVIANGQVYISSNYGSSFTIATGLGFSNMKSVSISQGTQGGYFQTGIQSTGNIYTANQVSYSNITKALWNGSYWTGIVSGALNPVLTSVNGLSWTNISGNPFSGNIIQNGFYSSRTNNSLFLSNTGNIFSTTTNNLSSLTLSTTGLISSPNALTYNGTYYLLGGNAVASSPDSRTWTYGSAISGMSKINNFAWNNPDQGSASIAPLSVAVGAGSNTIAYSIDGIYWQGTGASVFTVQGNKAVWNGRLWCAVGMGGYWVATSYDGVIWTGRDNYWMQQGYDIAWNGQIFIAVGYGLVTMAASSDGINWQGIVANPLNIYASSITWTGKIWLAYGSGTTTSTAYSPQLLGGGWQSTPQASIAVQNGQTVFTPAYFTTASLAGYSATASSQQTGNESYRAFDNKFSATTGQVTSWYSAAGTYAAATGQYLGSQTTSYNGGSITGEWLQIQLPQPIIAIYYYVVFAIDSSNTAIPKGWTLLGSQTGTSWTLIENFSFGSQTTPPNNTNGYPFLVIPRNINIGATYQYYRIVIPSVFGGGATNYAEIAEFDIYTATSATNQLNYLTRPIVTNTYVLHPTNLINVQGVGYPTFYIATDLCGNQINNYYLNQAGYANSIIYGLGANYPVAQTFDGQNYLVLANSGTAAYLSNQAANTTLNFSPTYNGATINTNLTKAYTAAYNKRSILLGGANGQIGSITYATLGTGSTPIFRSTNASSLFTAVYGIASNSGYGPVYVPNAIYMKPQEKISIIGPKAYPSAISNTAITMNLTNAQILTNITNSLNSIVIYGETGPQGPQGVIGVQGPVGIGPVGPKGDNGFIGQTATSGAQGQIGNFGLTGPMGPMAPYWQVLGSSILYSSNIGINNQAAIYAVDISGTANTISVSGDLIQVLQNIQVGGASTVQTQADISGSVIISNSMIIGTMNTPPSGGLYIAGSQNISNISYMNQIAENLAQVAPDSLGNLSLDLQQTASWVLDMSNCPNNITCQINNIPSTIINGFIYLTVYLDYSQAATPSGYYISSIVIGSQTYSILFNGGSPQNTAGATYFKQAIEIWISNSQIVRILSTI